MRVASDKDQVVRMFDPGQTNKKYANTVPGLIITRIKDDPVQG